MRMCYPIQKLQKDKTVTPNRFIERLYRREGPRQEYRESQRGILKIGNFVAPGNGQSQVIASVHRGVS